MIFILDISNEHNYEKIWCQFNIFFFDSSPSLYEKKLDNSHSRLIYSSKFKLYFFMSSTCKSVCNHNLRMIEKVHNLTHNAINSHIFSFFDNGFKLFHDV